MFDSEDALRKAASYEFVKYLTSAGVQADFAAGTGYIPVNTASTSDPAYQAVVEAYPQYEATFKQLEVTPTEMCSVTVGPSKDFYYAIAQDISDMLSYNQTVEETVEIMEDDLNGLLEEYLRSNPD
jgi:sn-glycerol 3-phosphate transport system substrate-binding protein